MIKTGLNLLERRLVCCCICLGWVMILLSSRLLLLLCFALIFCCYECGGGMCVGWGCREREGGCSAGIPTHLAHLAFALPLCRISPATHGKRDVLFVKHSALRAVHAILVFQASGTQRRLHDVAARLAGGAPLSSFIGLSRAPFCFYF